MESFGERRRLSDRNVDVVVMYEVLKTRSLKQKQKTTKTNNL